MSEAIYRKYRPSTFADVIGQEHVKTTIGNQIVSDSVAHAYLFTGPRGVGKTTVARVLARAVNCEKRKGFEPCNACDACREILAGSSLDVYEIDAASHTGVDNVRETIIESVRFAPNRLKYKVYIVDEVHMLSTPAFNALLKTLEEPPPYVVFVLATTELHKVPATIISRCQRFDFKRLKPEETVARLKELCQAEKRKVDDEVLGEIARHADGSERDAESLLGQVLAIGDSSTGSIGMEQASLVLPTTTHVMVESFLAALDGRNAAEAVRLVNQFADDGVDLPHFADDVISSLRERLLANVSSSSRDASTTATMIARLLVARTSMKSDRIPQLSLELAIVELCGSQEQEGRRQEGRKAERQEEKDFKEKGVDSGRPDPAGLAAFPPEGHSPSVSLHDIKRRWKDVFAIVMEKNASLPLVLQSGEPTAVVGNVVEISFTFAFHADTLNQEKNRHILAEALSSVFSSQIGVRGVHVPAEETISALVQEFGGSVV